MNTIAEEIKAKNMRINKLKKVPSSSTVIFTNIKEVPQIVAERAVKMIPFREFEGCIKVCYLSMLLAPAKG